MLRSLLVVTLLFSAIPGASAVGDKGSLAHQFVKLLRYEEQWAKYREQCSETYRAVSPEALVMKNPGYFGGIQPGDRRWPAIVVATADYYREACARPSKDEFLESLSSSYAAALSVRQLNEAISFYSSPTGQALVSAHKRAAADVYHAWATTNSTHFVEVSARYQRKLARLAQPE